MSVDGEDRSGRPSTGNTMEKVAKVREVILKTDDERFTMFATLSDCRKERATEFCRMSSTCGALKQNLFQGLGSRVACCAVVFGFYEYNTNPPPTLLAGPRPL
jgi:hypothetical protein